jgi:hypothetical protein
VGTGVSPPNALVFVSFRAKVRVLGTFCTELEKKTTDRRRLAPQQFRDAEGEVE